MKKIHYILVAFLILGSTAKSYSQQWVVPAGEGTLTNPLPFNITTVRDGKVIYEKNCKSCHGDPGKNNAVALVPPPPDPASAKMQANTDGGMHYKITTGRGGMPSFKSTLDDQQIWQAINFIRKFDPKNAGKIVDAPLKKGKLTASLSADKTGIDIVAETETGAKLANTPLSVLAKKTFGNYEIGKVTTDGEGKAHFKLPADLTGNAAGMANIAVAFGDDYEPVTAEVKEIKVSEPVSENPLARGNVLWSTNDRTSGWLLFAYFFVTGLVWLGILYIVWQIVKIKRAS